MQTARIEKLAAFKTNTLSRNKTGKPVVMVAGCPRSGSTILAKTLSLSTRTGYLEEPLNPATGIEGTNDTFVLPEAHPGQRALYDDIANAIKGGKARYKESYFKPENPGIARKIFYAMFVNRYHFTYKLGTLNPLAGLYISKDPTASLATEYLHRKHDYKVILTLRHPCGVIASHQRLGWVSPVAHLLSKPEIVHYLGEEGKKLKVELLTEVEQWAWYWRAVNEVLYDFAKRNERMLIVEHEEFSKHPLAITRALYDWLELPYTKRIERKISSLTGAGNPTDPRADRAHTLKRNSRDNIERWRKHLSQEDVATIERITKPTYEKLQSLPNVLRAEPAVVA